MPYNDFNLRKPSWPLIFSGQSGGVVRLGSGFNMSDPDNPIKAPYFAFVNEEEFFTSAKIAAEEISVGGTLNFSFIEFQSVKEVARTINAYFRASFGLSNARASYEYAYARKDVEKSIVAIVEKVIAGPSLDRDALFRWRETPRAETVQEAERLRQFVDDYGSHYLRSASLGFRFAIRGAFQSTKESEFARFAAAFKAAFSGLSAGGGVSSSDRKTLTTSEVSLSAVVTASDIKKFDDSGKPIPGAMPFLLTGYEQIVPLLEDIREGSVRLHPAALNGTVVSFWHLVADYPNSRNALAESNQLVVGANNGVPAGTIIAWTPLQHQIFVDPESNEETYQVPDGWALCDGLNDETPDLTGRFLRGGSVLAEVGSEDGAEEHVHDGETNTHTHQGVVEGAGLSFLPNGRSRNHKHKFKTMSASNLPPFVRVLYIMKR